MSQLSLLSLSHTHTARAHTHMLAALMRRRGGLLGGSEDRQRAWRRGGSVGRRGLLGGVVGFDGRQPHQLLHQPLAVGVGFERAERRREDAILGRKSVRERAHPCKVCGRGLRRARHPPCLRTREKALEVAEVPREHLRVDGFARFFLHLIVEVDAEARRVRHHRRANHGISFCVEGRIHPGSLDGVLGVQACDPGKVTQNGRTLGQLVLAVNLKQRYLSKRQRAVLLQLHEVIAPLEAIVFELEA
mmetsp:Transcript_12139/g.28987  ORF Transcript_12139/g.28987 Transcript_12139/m.28987 type:complete len:246 (+) Transcript_12139:88-825(+)